ncbi:Protein BANP [Portunus trituberculatus]|uniref:Protein BANP n=1 Tax=Portunus trituberculatus TaxID=210409 RepID=A0A5B7EUC9_PORTR|nr:Protein BANP [Portunus trituberculatus]
MTDSSPPPYACLSFPTISGEVTEIRTCMNTRLTLLENKVSVLVHTCNKISSRLDTMEQLATNTTSPHHHHSATSASSTSSSSTSKQSDQNVGMGMGMDMAASSSVLVQDTESSANMNVISLNSEDDFPHGSWLGDPSQPNMRVRCPITPHHNLKNTTANPCLPQQVITQSPTCELRILNATPEQISQLQDTQEIILSEEQILTPPSLGYIGGKALAAGKAGLEFEVQTPPPNHYIPTTQHHPTSSLVFSATPRHHITTQVSTTPMLHNSLCCSSPHKALHS